MSIVYLSLGSNEGDRHALLDAAVALVGDRVGEVQAVSSYHETEPWGFASSNKFLNAALCVSTTLRPFEVLAVTQQIECELGRTHKSTGSVYHDRPIDIDLLLWRDVEGVKCGANDIGAMELPFNVDGAMCGDLRSLSDPATLRSLGFLSLNDTSLVNGRQQRLNLPHPLMFERDFVLRPLAEVWKL